ncbi:hypothetical protein [Campylobacter sp.]|uniref:hypothetical protein n=1 Tax=Campylobacter sp. TaxID=205 RepID=UPI002A747464|nr:hypothetical protein [Campylobacter sp.]
MARGLREFLIFIGSVRGRFLSSKPCAAQLLWRNFRTVFLQLCLEKSARNFASHYRGRSPTVSAAARWAKIASRPWSLFILSAAAKQTQNQ